MNIHPRPDYEDPGRFGAHLPASTGSGTAMYERDHLFTRERVAHLRATATQLRPGAAARGASVLERTRRTIGRGLIAVGTVVAGATAELKDTAVEVRATADAQLAN